MSRYAGKAGSVLCGTWIIQLLRGRSPGIVRGTSRSCWDLLCGTARAAGLGMHHRAVSCSLGQSKGAENTPGNGHSSSPGRKCHPFPPEICIQSPRSKNIYELNNHVAIMGSLLLLPETFAFRASHWGLLNYLKCLQDPAQKKHLFLQC